MYNSQRQYDQTELEKAEAAERLAHEEEMHRAQERLEKRAVRRKKSFVSAAIGVFFGLIYILWVAFAPEIRLGSQSLYGAYISLAGDSMALCALLDFAPPIVLSGVAAFFAARGEKGRAYFVLTSISALLVVVMVFLLYMSMMAG